MARTAIGHGSQCSSEQSPSLMTIHHSIRCLQTAQSWPSKVGRRAIRRRNWSHTQYPQGPENWCSCNTGLTRSSASKIATGICYDKGSFQGSAITRAGPRGRFLNDPKLSRHCNVRNFLSWFWSGFHRLRLWMKLEKCHDSGGCLEPL